MASKSILSFAQTWQFVSLLTIWNLLANLPFDLLPYLFSHIFIKNLPVYSPWLHKKSFNYFWLGGFPIYRGPSISANIPSTLNVSNSRKMCLMFFTINPKNQQMLILHLVLLLPLVMYLYPIHFCMGLII